MAPFNYITYPHVNPYRRAPSRPPTAAPDVPSLPRVSLSAACGSLPSCDNPFVLPSPQDTTSVSSDETVVDCCGDVDCPPPLPFAPAPVFPMLTQDSTGHAFEYFVRPRGSLFRRHPSPSSFSVDADGPLTQGSPIATLPDPSAFLPVPPSPRHSSSSSSDGLIVGSVASTTMNQPLSQKRMVPLPEARKLAAKAASNILPPCHTATSCPMDFTQLLRLAAGSIETPLSCFDVLSEEEENEGEDEPPKKVRGTRIFWSVEKRSGLSLPLMRYTTCSSTRFLQSCFLCDGEWWIFRWHARRVGGISAKKARILIPMTVFCSGIRRHAVISRVSHSSRILFWAIRKFGSQRSYILSTSGSARLRKRELLKPWGSRWKLRPIGPTTYEKQSHWRSRPKLTI